MTAQKSILIVGAGIGGLAAGCYARMNGYRAHILEMHGLPGGLCTSWHRHGYTFDGCIHNLAGTVPASAFHAIWRELGVVPALPMHSYSELVRMERPDGVPLTLYSDLDRLERHLKELAPGDAAPIEELVRGARGFTRVDLLGLTRTTWPVRIAALARAAPTLCRYGNVTLERFAQRFSDPFLRRAFPTLLYDWPQQSLTMLLYFLGRAHIGDFGWAMGGSLAFARAIEQRFLQLGGTIQYHACVQSILVENDRAVGVCLNDGSEQRADIVISNANGHATIFDMLGGRYTSPAIRAYYDAPQDRIEMGIHVSLGIARDLSVEPHAIVLPLERPTMIANEMRDRFYVEPFGFDASLAPPGKSALKVVMATSFRYWQELHRDPQRYAEEKDRIAQRTIDALAQRWPGVRGEIEVVDVATPMTTLRFTGNGHGFRVAPNAMMLAMIAGRRLSQTLPGLGDFYMVGQWAGSPSVPLVAAMGRDVARDICRRDGRPFVAEQAKPDNDSRTIAAVRPSSNRRDATQNSSTA